MSKNQGRRKEREFIKEMADEGVPILKTPSSGSGTSRELPDFLMVLNGELVAGEHKYSSNSDYCYFNSEKMDDLQKFCDNWGATPLLVSRWSGDTNHYYIPLNSEEAGEEKTPSGNISMKKGNRENYEVLEEEIYGENR